MTNGSLNGCAISSFIERVGCRCPNVRLSNANGLSHVECIRIMDGHDAMNHISVDEN